MKTLPPTAMERLAELRPSLGKVIESMKARNDALQMHLTSSGWAIRRIEPAKPKDKETNDGRR